MIHVLQVLLVEDEDLISMLTEDMLTDLGYGVNMSVANLADGLEAAACGSFDVAVLDINLRGVSSYPIADILAERGIPFVFVSGYSPRGIDPRYPKIPALQKPFTAEGLGQILSRTLASTEVR